MLFAAGGEGSVLILRDSDFNGLMKAQQTQEQSPCYNLHLIASFLFLNLLF